MFAKLTLRTCILLAISAAGWALTPAAALAAPQRTDKSDDKGGGQRSLVFSPDAAPYGKSYGEWSAQHWQWLLSIPASTNPANDFTGANGAVGQSGNVWFLAGSFCPEPQATCSDFTVTRNLSVPAGTALFFPLLDSECSTVEGNGSTDAELRSCASGFMDLGTGLSCDIDGVSITDLNSYRVQSPFFAFGPLPAGNILGVPAGSTSPSVSDGVFLMVKPLDAGSHTIHFTGAIPTFGFGMHITYNLTVLAHADAQQGLQAGSQSERSRSGPPVERKRTSWGRVKMIYR